MMSIIIFPVDYRLSYTWHCDNSFSNTFIGTIPQFVIFDHHIYTYEHD
jgi:hypothetical protein